MEKHSRTRVFKTKRENEMKSKAETVLRKMSFKGSYAELQELLSGAIGKWKDLGATKQFIYKWDGSLIWWPDTGDLLKRGTGDQMFDREPNDKLPLVSKRLTSGWTTITRGKCKGLSLPMWFIHDPLTFAECYGLDYFTGVLRDEADEIYAKGRVITIPKLNSKELVVVHRADQDDQYTGFTLEPAHAQIMRHRGHEILDHVIDVQVAHTMTCLVYDDEHLKCMSKAFSRSLMNAVDGNHPKAWDKARCESFFNEISNFVISSGVTAQPAKSVHSAQAA